MVPSTYCKHKFSVCLNLVPFPQSMGSATWKPATLSRIGTPRKSTKVSSLNDWTKAGKRRTRHLPPKPQETSKCLSSISSSLSPFQCQVKERCGVRKKKNPQQWTYSGSYSKSYKSDVIPAGLMLLQELFQDVFISLGSKISA